MTGKSRVASVLPTSVSASADLLSCDCHVMTHTLPVTGVIPLTLIKAMGELWTVVVVLVGCGLMIACCAHIILGPHHILVSDDDSLWVSLCSVQ